MKTGLHVSVQLTDVLCVPYQEPGVGEIFALILSYLIWLSPCVNAEGAHLCYSAAMTPPADMASQ